MKLFEIEVTSRMLVWAKDDREAEKLAQRELSDLDYETDATEVKPGSPVWHDLSDAEPFGDAPDEFYGLTMDQIQEKWAEEPGSQFEFDPYTLPLPGV